MHRELSIHSKRCESKSAIQNSIGDRNWGKALENLTNENVNVISFRSYCVNLWRLSSYAAAMSVYEGFSGVL